MSVDGRDPGGLDPGHWKLVVAARPELLKLARSIAWRFPRLTIDEIAAVAEDAISGEAPRFDPEWGTSLVQFARKAIVGDLQRAAQKIASHRLQAALDAGLVHDDAVEGVDLATQTTETVEDVSARALAMGADRATAMYTAYVGKTVEPSCEDELGEREEVALALVELAATSGQEAANLLHSLYWQDLDWERAALALGVSVSSAKRIEAAAIRRLRAILPSLRARRGSGSKPSL